jgi:hypothetical protein
MSEDHERTASLMSPAKLAQMKPKAAASPAAWLDQMAADAGHMHVRQLAELTARLQSQGGEDRGDAPLVHALQSLEQALPRLDVSLLQPKGWLARATGKAKSAAAEFNGQFEAIVACADAVRREAQAWQKRHTETGLVRERSLVEFEVEWRAIDKIIDQGARWLQDMRNQLKARQAAGADAAEQDQIRQDAARCELLLARLKLLRGVATAAQQVQQQGQGAGARRTSLAQMLHQGLAGDIKNWQARWVPVAAAAGDSGSPVLGLDGPEEAARQLQSRLGECIADLGQLAGQEQALGESLAALAQQLRAAT